MAGSVTMTGLSITGKETVDPASAGGEAPSRVAHSAQKARRRDREGRPEAGASPCGWRGQARGGGVSRLRGPSRAAQGIAGSCKDVESGLTEPCVSRI